MLKFKMLSFLVLVSVLPSVDIYASAAATSTSDHGSDLPARSPAPAASSSSHYLSVDAQQEFNTTVDKFKPTTEKYKFGQQFITNPANEALYNEVKAKFQEFLKTPIVIRNITRSSGTLTFDDHGPTSCPEQEIWLYKTLQELYVWTYRGCIGNPPLTSTELDDEKEGGFYDIGHQDETLFRSFLKKINSSVVLMGIQPGRLYYDIWKTRETLDAFDMQGFVGYTAMLSKPLPTRVWVNPSGKDNHAYLLVHILDESRTHIITSVFINSYLKNIYFDSFAESFHKPRNMQLLEPITGSQFKHLELRIINDKVVEVQRRVPLIDASHNLQTINDDQNCPFYSHNFCLAVGNMMADASISARVFRLAETIEDQVVHTRDPGASINELKIIFQNDLKAFLPQYYNKGGSSRTAAELKAFHMGQRWDISGDRIITFAETGE